MPKPEPTLESDYPNTFAGRKAEREARIAAGERPIERAPTSFRAGADAETPTLVVTRVQA